MAKRLHKKYRTIESTAVQGEGSFVKVKSMTINEMMGYGNSKDKDADPAKLGLQILDDMIVDWNWVDDDDNPLPIPAENPGTVASLPFQESTWLLNETGLQETFNTKNSSSG